MKAEYINPFLAASINLFNAHLRFNVKNAPPYINQDAQNLNEVSAIIGLAGDIAGAVVLSFTRETAITMATRFSGQKHVGLSKEVLDAIGEMVNIISGNAKRDLTEFRIEISLPGVITGNKYKINWPQGVPVITIPFDSEAGSFTVNVSFKQGKA
jgi:chemotaxis protein CheX